MCRGEKQILTLSVEFAGRLLGFDDYVSRYSLAPVTHYDETADMGL